jgi:Skp family chaperone for outer membrane proteins
MKKAIITSTLILCAAMGFSQPAPDRKPLNPEQVAQREANALSERLSLNEDQRSKAYSIYLDRASKDIAAREERMKEMQKQRELATAEQKDQQDKISQLLNADQKKTYENMRSRMNDRRQGPDGASGMRQGPQGQGLGFRRGPGEQFQGQGAQGERFQRDPADQSGRPDGPRAGFQRGPGQEFRGQGAPGLRSQRGEDGQIQGRPMGRNFRDRFDRQDRFQKGGLRHHKFKHKMHRKFHKHRHASKNKTRRSENQQNRLDVAPKNRIAPADNSK